MTTFPWLTVLAVLPLIGALALVFIKGALARTVGLAFSLVTLVISIGVAIGFDPGSGMQFVEQQSWIPAIGASYSLGVDGMGLLMVLLTTILVPVVLIAVWDDPDANDGRWTSQTFFALALLLEGLSLYVFMATDVLLFYLFFEATLIPMYFLIGGFGGKKRNSAAMKFLLFSLAGGLVMLVAVIGIYAVTAGLGQPTYALQSLQPAAAAGLFDTPVGKWLFAGFFIAFAIKAPMVPVHTWLADAAEASHPGSATLMVSVLDKIGTFGMLRFCLGLFPEASVWATPFVLVLALISIVYGAVAAIGQRHLMRFVAFTSVSHFGFMVMGIFAMTTSGIAGSIFYMFNHGLSTAALFLVVGFMVKRRGSADIAAFGGVQKVAPVMAGFLLLSGLSALALPGLSSFVSEFMVLAGTFSRTPWIAALAASALLLSAIYVMAVYQRTMTGPVTDQVTRTVHADLTLRERVAVVPLLAIILVLGFFPRPALQLAEPQGAQTVAAMQSVGVSEPQPQIPEGKN
ncbi:NADH-quinone oxidoreductase subunit M [Raineyella sp. LH-20]|uniref:NADH-quinone oxidoreductase subunit M n=1 Tax=Raineyella sp. LH-20 TaxID=3081204 RepID=UPI002954A087|nr:NADH-quinone oxidoreductase subunit M [Raineyella sp. LH-20]WOP19027.1 NADH-quinone oxidoreductase subunit M [Raineyella sp. LH-20]